MKNKYHDVHVEDTHGHYNVQGPNLQVEEKKAHHIHALTQNINAYQQT